MIANKPKIEFYLEYYIISTAKQNRQNMINFKTAINKLTSDHMA